MMGQEGETTVRVPARRGLLEEKSASGEDKRRDKHNYTK